MSEKNVELDSNVPHCLSCLLIMVAYYSLFTYFSEKKGVGIWEMLRVPTDTCILYANSCGC